MTLTDRNHATPLKFKLIQAAFQVGGAIAPGLAARYAMNIFRTPRKRSETTGDLFDRATIGSVSYLDFNLTSYTWEPSAPADQTEKGNLEATR